MKRSLSLSLSCARALKLSLFLSSMMMFATKSNAQTCPVSDILLIDETVDEEYHWPFFWNNDDENGDDIAYAGALIDDDEDGEHDDGVVIVGETNNGDSNIDAFIILLNEVGQAVWSQAVIRGGGLNDIAYSVIQGSNDHIIVCGITQTSNVGSGTSKNIWFFELDLSGALVSGSEQEYGGSGQDEGWDIIEDEANDQYVIVGRAGDVEDPDEDLCEHESINGSGELWVFAIERDDYEIKWEKTYLGGWPGGNGMDWARSILIDADGKYLVTGYCSSCEPDKTQYEARLVKIEPDDGDLIWKKAFGYNPSTDSRDQGSNDAIEVVEGENTYYVAAGIHHPSQSANCFGGHNHDVYLAKADEDDGSNSWTGGCELDEGKNYGGKKKDDGQSIVRTCDGDYLVVGGAGPSAVTTDDITCNHDEDGQSPHASDGWIVKMNSAGVIQWDESLGDVNEDEFHELLELEDGSFIAIGEFGSITTPDENQNVYAVKFELTDCANPSNLTSSTEATCKIKFDWDGHSCAKTYLLQYREKNTSSWTKVTTSQTEYTTGTLAAGTYEWKLRVKCSPNVFSDLIDGSDHNLCLKASDEIADYISDHLTVFPNPSNGNSEVLLQLPLETDALVTFEILDQAGKLVSSLEAPVEKGYLTGHTSLDHLPQGFYWIRIVANGNSYVTKLVIHRN
jgi:hypothetical protein